MKEAVQHFVKERRLANGKVVIWNGRAVRIASWQSMNLVEMSKMYADLAQAKQEISEEEYHAKGQADTLRTKRQERIMAKTKHEGMQLSGRSEATNKAFQRIPSENSSPR